MLPIILINDMSVITAMLAFLYAPDIIRLLHRKKMIKDLVNRLAEDTIVRIEANKQVGKRHLDIDCYHRNVNPSLYKHIGMHYEDTIDKLVIKLFSLGYVVWYNPDGGLLSISWE